MKIFKEFLDTLRFKGNIKEALTENKKDLQDLINHLIIKILLVSRQIKLSSN